MPGAEGAGGGCDDVERRNAAGGGDEARRSSGRKQAGADRGARGVDGREREELPERGRRRDKQSEEPLRVQPCLASVPIPFGGDSGDLAVDEVQQAPIRKPHDIEEPRAALQGNGFEARASGCIRLNRRESVISSPFGKLLSQVKEAVLEGLPVMPSLPRRQEGL